MPAAILLLTLGGMMVVSALKGVSLPDLLTGKGGNLDASGGKITPVTGFTSGVNTIGDAVTGILTSNGGWTGMQAEMDRMTALNTPYKWGGGHAGYTSKGPWDCSGAVSQVLHVAGLLSGAPRTSTGLMVWGKAGKGSDFTVYANPTHAFIMAESGPHAGQAWGTTNQTGRGGPAWHHHTTVGFIPRHP